jgi:prevent-host-death family protein
MTVPAADANRRFSSLLRAVRGGRTIVITSHGRVVAKLVPAGDRSPRSSKASASLIGRLRAQSLTRVGRWTRDELYDRAE